MTVRAPSPIDFEEGEDFRDAPDLAQMADRLIRLEPNRFGFVSQFQVAYLWKKKGGKTRGQLRMGLCKKPGGDLKYFSGKDAVIWVAADHHATLDERRIEATLFHELMHLSLDSPEDGEESLTLVGHDFEGFAAEVVKYGDILDDVQVMAGAFRQLAMFEGER